MSNGNTLEIVIINSNITMSCQHFVRLWKLAVNSVLADLYTHPELIVCLSKLNYLLLLL